MGGGLSFLVADRGLAVLRGNQGAVLQRTWPREQKLQEKLKESFFFFFFLKKHIYIYIF